MTGLQSSDSENEKIRNYTYAQFGKVVLDQPGHFAWQVFDAKDDDLLYAEYSFHDAHFVDADTLDGLFGKLDGITPGAAKATLDAYNTGVNDDVDFESTSLNDKNTIGLTLPKSNWAQKLDTSPFKVYPITGGITFNNGQEFKREVKRRIRSLDVFNPNESETWMTMVLYARPYDTTAIGFYFETAEQFRRKAKRLVLQETSDHDGRKIVSALPTEGKHESETGNQEEDRSKYSPKKAD